MINEKIQNNEQSKINQAELDKNESEQVVKDNKYYDRLYDEVSKCF